MDGLSVNVGGGRVRDTISSHLHVCYADDFISLFIDTTYQALVFVSLPVAEMFNC